MKAERYFELDQGLCGLTEEEISQGWHFCQDWDFLLVGPGMDELEVCTCFKGENAKDTTTV